MSHTWTGANPLYRVGGNNIEPGEEFEPTETELESFGELIDKIESDESQSDSESAESEAPTEVEDAEAETYTCGVNGCSRDVESEDATCWQHNEE